MGGRTIMFLIIFILMALQMLLSMVQYKQYQKTVKEMLKGALLGIGHRKGSIRSGEILILAYDQANDRVTGCKSMKGLTIFAKFKDKPEYAGLTLLEAREVGVELDAKDMGRYRRKHPYDATVLSKKKGAFIQAVEAIELRLRNQARRKEEEEEEETLAFGAETV